MYRVFAVNYDLRAKAKPDYKGLEDELRRSYRWWHYLESTWLIATAETADGLYNRLAPYLHKVDSVLVIEVRDNRQGWLPQPAWQWIRDNMPLPETTPV